MKKKIFISILIIALIISCFILFRRITLPQDAIFAEGDSPLIDYMGKRGNPIDIKLSDEQKDVPYVVETYYSVNDSEYDSKIDEFTTLVKHYKMSDGTWKTDDYLYQYRLEITGRMNNAAKDRTFVFLSNIETITFDQAWKASGFSSNLNDYFDIEDAKFVSLK